MLTVLLLGILCAIIVLCTVIVWAALHLSGIISQEERKEEQARFDEVIDYINETGENENPNGR